ncbi:MAG: pseudouridine synthase [Gammaproteobacteria bacterium]
MNYRPPPNTGLDILFQDATLLILNKPSGLLSVPGRGVDKQDCLLSRVLEEYPQALTVHRLDMDTSGIMLIALGKDSQRQFSGLFQNRTIRKTYHAMVNGYLKQTEGQIDLPLITDWPNRPRQIVDHLNGKASITCFQTLEYNTDNDSTLVELSPLTGRSHQLRVHMQAIGHPILGDALYATPKAKDKAPRLLLHASLIDFDHPYSKRRIIIKSKYPWSISGSEHPASNH